MSEPWETGAAYAEDGSVDATARVVDAGGGEDERVVEAALRPRRLAEFPGQTKVRDQLGLVLEAARRTETTIARPGMIARNGAIFGMDWNFSFQV